MACTVQSMKWHGGEHQFHKSCHVQDVEGKRAVPTDCYDPNENITTTKI